MSTPLPPHPWEKVGADLFKFCLPGEGCVVQREAEG